MTEIREQYPDATEGELIAQAIHNLGETLSRCFFAPHSVLFEGFTAVTEAINNVGSR